MDKDDEKIVQKYFKDGKYKKKDADRLARKSVLHGTGERQNEPHTTIAARYVVTGFQEQELEAKQYAGNKTARLKRAKLVQRNKEILEQAAELMASGRTPRSINSILSQRHDLSAGHIRRIRKNAK